MKFNCGPNYAKIEREAQRQREEHAKKKQWHRHFAWWPVKVGKNDCRWLEFVERKGEYKWDYRDYEYYWDWEYRAIKE